MHALIYPPPHQKKKKKKAQAGNEWWNIFPKSRMGGKSHRQLCSAVISLLLQVPCKYNAVQQQCGPYLVTLTPAHRYLYPQYIMDSIWLSVKSAADDSTLWEGRTTNKIAALVSTRVC